MKAKYGLILGITGLLLLLSAGLVLSEDQADSPAAGPGQVKSDADTQWIWGEVIKADAPNKTITIKYLDYETDQEKEAEISADSATTYENIKSLEEVGPKDTLSIDYMVVDGKNIAKNISLEKPESTPTLPPSPEIKTDNSQTLTSTQPGITAAADTNPANVQPTGAVTDNKSVVGDAVVQQDTGSSDKTETVNQAGQ